MNRRKFLGFVQFYSNCYQIWFRIFEDQQTFVLDLCRSSFGEQRCCCARGQRHWARRCARAGERDSDAAVTASPDGVQALSGGLVVGSGEIDGAFVDFDARDEVVVAEELDERDTPVVVFG
ncbi:hypothetical protein U1Q18_030458 [Sarracenia purpurea var. burkii]